MRRFNKFLFAACLIMVGVLFASLSRAESPVFVDVNGDPLSNDQGLYRVDGNYFAIDNNELKTVSTLNELYSFGARGLKDYGAVKFSSGLLVEVTRIYNSMQKKFEGRSYTAEALEFLSRPEVFVANHRFLKYEAIDFMGDKPGQDNANTDEAEDEENDQILPAQEPQELDIKSRTYKLYPEGQSRIIDRYNPSKILPHRLIIRFNPYRMNIKFGLNSQKAEALLESKGLSVITVLKMQNTIIAEHDGSRQGQVLADKLTALPEIQEAYLDRTVPFEDLGVNDPLASQQWALENTGQNGYEEGSDISAKEAWQLLEDNNTSERVLVAYVDSGWDYRLPEFAGSAVLWDGSDCLDANGQYLGGCIHGYDFVYRDKDPVGFYNDHGNMTSGVVGAAKNNEIGIAGLSTDNVEIMMLTVYTTANVTEAVNFAKQNGAKIINVSLAYPSYDPLLYEAMRDFPGLIVPGAGNDWRNIDDNPMYPAAFDLDNIITIAASDSADNRAYFSNYGTERGDVAAPGVNIWTTSSEKVVYKENFDSGKPGDWAFDGNWEVRDAGYMGPVLFPDQGNPYSANANMTATSPVLNLDAETASVNFYTACETEENYNGEDAMSFEVSGDGGQTYRTMYKWDMWTLGLQPGDMASKSKHLEMGFTSKEMTENFRFRVRWQSNGTDNDHAGCYIERIEVDAMSAGAITENYIKVNGTSLSAPFATGAAALVWSFNPSLTTAEVKSALIEGVDKLDNWASLVKSGGRINVYESLALQTPRLGYLDAGSPVLDALTAPQVGNGQSLVTIPFRLHYEHGPAAATLSEFQYSYDKNTWNALPGGDSSTALSANWQSSNYSAGDIATGSEYQFTLDMSDSGAGELNGYEGDLYFRFRANAGGYSGPLAATEALAVDNEPPQISGAPQVVLDEANLSGTVTLNISDSGSGIDYSVSPTVVITGLTQEYAVNQTAYSAGVWTGSFNYTQADDTMTGTVEYSGFADMAGNLSPLASGGAFVMDLSGDGGEPPVEVYVTGLANNNAPSQAVSWTWGSNEADVSYRYLVTKSSSSDGIENEAWGSTTSASATGDDGKWYIHVQAKHSSGVESDIVSVYGMLDTTPPPIGLVTPPSDTYETSVTLLVQDDEDLAYYKYSLDNGQIISKNKEEQIVLSGLSVGQHKIQLWGVDEAGNESASPAIYYWLVEEVNVQVTGLMNDDVPSQTVSWAWGANAADVTFRYLVTKSAASDGIENQSWGAATGAEVTGEDGKWYIHVQAKHSTGVLSEIVSVYGILDTTPPPISLSNPPSDGYETSLSLSVAEDSDLYQYKYSLDAGSQITKNKADDIELSGLSVGAHELRLWGIDRAGNQSSAVSYTWQIQEPPVIGVTGLANDTVPKQSVGWSWGSNVAEASFRYLINQSESSDGLEAVPWSGVTTAQATGEDGKWYIHVQAKHPTGYLSGIHTVFAILDTTPPSISLTSAPADGTETSLTLSVANDSDLYQYKYSLDAGSQITKAKAEAIELSGLSVGAHELRLWGIDRAGNQSNAVSYSWQTTAPEKAGGVLQLKITGAVSEERVRSYFWEWEYENAVNPVYRYEFTESSEPSELADKDYQEGKVSYTAMSKNGKWYIHIQAKDLDSGEESEVKTGSAIFDNTAPTAVLTNPPEDTTVTNYRFEVRGDEDMVGYIYSLDENDPARMMSLTDLVIEGLTWGNHKLQLWGIDDLGNEQIEATEYEWTINRPQATIAGGGGGGSSGGGGGGGSRANRDNDSDESAQDETSRDTGKQSGSSQDPAFKEPDQPLPPSQGYVPVRDVGQEAQMEVRQIKNKEMGKRLHGKIVLRVQANGEAYYIDDNTSEAYYMGRPANAFELMRQKGVGILTVDLNRLPIGLIETGYSQDQDGDGLSDLLEDAIGTDKTVVDTDGDGYDDKTEVESGYLPVAVGRIEVDAAFAEKHKGKIFLQVEQNGEAWYVNPADGKRYFLGRPADAFAIMRTLGLGISEESFGMLAE